MLSDRQQAQLSRITIAGVRILVGLMWLANVHWKRPANFGGTNGSGLAKWIDFGIKYPVVGPYSDILENVVRPNIVPFGWFTLISEATIAALLILGLKTQLAGLAGAGMSAAIGLTILTTPHEWPWAYFLMIGIHLLLVATDAGRTFGLDGLAPNVASRSRAWVVLGVLGLGIGVAGLVASIDDPFTAEFGSLVGVRSWELKLFWFNTLGAMVCIVIGVLAIAAGLLKNSKIALAGSFLALLATLQVLIQWRAGSGGETGGILGGTGGTMCLWMVLFLGLGLTAGSMKKGKAE
jgi:uncharacterized membrane protein YphA (DoxX/SURF4 family)